MRISVRIQLCAFIQHCYLLYGYGDFLLCGFLCELYICVSLLSCCMNVEYFLVADKFFLDNEGFSCIIFSIK